MRIPVNILSRWSIFLSFIALIVAGGLILQHPAMRTVDIKLVDTMFIAASAVCVTGLVTIPMDYFTTSGQIAIMILIQLGGLGIITFTTAGFLIISGKLSLTQRVFTSEAASTIRNSDLEGLIKAIFIYTFLVEFIGFVLLFIGFTYYNIENPIFNAVFHSVSAFCNAGFSPFNDNMIGMPSYIKVVISCLIIFGGLGFYCAYNVWGHIAHKKRLIVHTKLIIYATTFLLVAGTAAIMFTERGAISFVDAFFQAVTCRTAGFASVNLTLLSKSTILIMIMLMLVGTAPGSTGGGMKVTAVAVALLSIYNSVRGRKDTVLWNRKIAQDSINRCFAIIVLYMLTFSSVIFIMLFYGGGVAGFEAVIFEVASALGTVGLSLDLTPKLPDFLKVVIIMTMYVGRLGPAFCTLLFVPKQKEQHVHSVEENIIVM